MFVLQISLVRSESLSSGHARTIEEEDDGLMDALRYQPDNDARRDVESLRSASSEAFK